MKIFGRRARPTLAEAAPAANQSEPQAYPLYEAAVGARVLREGIQSERAASRPTARELCASVLSAGSSWRGKMKIEGSLLVEGELTGQIQAKHTVQIGKSARVDASIRAPFVIIAGSFKGRVNSEHVVLLPTAQTRGDFRTAALVIGEGARADGRMHMKESKPKAPRQRRMPRNQGSG